MKAKVVLIQRSLCLFWEGSSPLSCSSAVPSLVDGFGQVMSAPASEQNSLIFSNKYFCLLASSPGGGTGSSRSSGGKMPGEQFSTKHCSSFLFEEIYRCLQLIVSLSLMKQYYRQSTHSRKQMAREVCALVYVKMKDHMSPN